MRRRERPTRRPFPTLGISTILVFCGSERTEGDYLEGIRRVMRPGAAVKVRCDGVDPNLLVRRAAEYRDRHPARYDEVWCVIDTDEFDVTAAAVLARQYGVNLAVSNPCFELWLLLHHDKCEAYLSGCREAHERLRKHLPLYDKTSLRFADFVAGMADAVERARGLDPSGEDHLRNPSTGMWQLLERILQ